MPAPFRRSGDATDDPPVEALVRIEPVLLAITADDRLYYQLLSASIDLGWKIMWARTSLRAIDLCCSRPATLIVYDQCLHGGGWYEILPCLADFPGHPLVLLAASHVDEKVWERVLGCGGYDAVRRRAGSDEWKRELRFAWNLAELVHRCQG